MTVRFTSLAAYRQLQADGTAFYHTERIYAELLVRRRPMSRREVAHETGIETSAIPRAVNELIKLGLVVELEVDDCPITGRLVRPIKAAGEDDE
jgi:predicted ArsR family transcriptional regulator